VIAVAKEFIKYRRRGPGRSIALYDTIDKEVTRAFDLPRSTRTRLAMRDEFYDYYNSTDYFNYHISQARRSWPRGSRSLP